MEKFLLKVIDKDGNLILNDTNRLGRTHADSFKLIKDIDDVNFSSVNRLDMSLTLADSKKYMLIFDADVAYCFILPEKLSDGQIAYLEHSLHDYEIEEEKGKIIETILYSKEILYYNHKNYRELALEEKINILEGKKIQKSSSCDLLWEELNRQKNNLRQNKSL